MCSARSNGNAANVMLHLPEVLGADKVQLSWKLLAAQCAVINLERKRLQPWNETSCCPGNVLLGKLRMWRDFCRKHIQSGQLQQFIKCWPCLVLSGDVPGKQGRYLQCKYGRQESSDFIRSRAIQLVCFHPSV